MSGTKKAGAWRRRLEKGDLAELLKWVEQSGLERVARIIGTLTDAAGESGPPDKLETLLLLKMAHLKRQQPNRKVHAIAVEVAGEAKSVRKNLPDKTSLVSRLERAFKEYRHKWTTLANSAPEPSRENIIEDGSKSKTTNEFRALARIVDLLPNRIDLFDTLLAEVQKLGPETVELVKKFGRERAEPLLVAAIKKQITSAAAVNAQGVPPRRFFDFIGPELERYRQQLESRRRRKKGDVRSVGRN